MPPWQVDTEQTSLSLCPSNELVIQDQLELNRTERGSSGEPSMRPGDGSGGAGGVPAARMGEMESAAWMEEEPDLVLHGFAGEAATTRRHDGGGSFGAPATRTPAIDCGDHISFTGLGDYADVSLHGREMMYNGNQFESVDIVGTQFSVNQPADDILHGQIGSNMDWTIFDAEHGQDKGFVDDETDSNHYDDFLVRCEGDTDAEDCFPTQITREEVVVEEDRPRIERLNQCVVVE